MLLDHCKFGIGWHLEKRSTCQLVLERLAIAQLGALLNRPRNDEMQGHLQRSPLSHTGTEAPHFSRAG